MKRTAIISALLLLVGATAYADSMASTNTSGVTVAYDRVNHLDWGIYGAGMFNDNGVDDSGYVSTQLSYGITPWIAIGAEVGWGEADAANDETAGTWDVLGDIIIRIPQHPFSEMVVPYGVVGLGVIGRYVEDSDGVGPNNNGADQDDTSFGWKLGGGFDWFLNQNWALNFEVAYFDSSDLDLAPTSLGNASDASWWTIGGGVKVIW